MNLFNSVAVGVGLNKLAVDIAKSFEGVITEKPVKVQKIYQC